MQIDTLTLFVSYLDQLADVGWVYVGTEHDAQKVVKFVNMLGCNTEYCIVKEDSYFIELLEE